MIRKIRRSVGGIDEAFNSQAQSGDQDAGSYHELKERDGEKNPETMPRQLQPNWNNKRTDRSVLDFSPFRRAMRKYAPETMTLRGHLMTALLVPTGTHFAPADLSVSSVPVEHHKAEDIPYNNAEVNVTRRPDMAQLIS